MSNRHCTSCSKRYRNDLYRSKVEAANGASTYHGSKCAMCGGSERRVGSDICVACQHDYDIARRALNPDAERLRSRLWCAANPDKRIANNRRRRAIAAGAVGSHTTRDTSALLEAQGGLCAYCDEPAAHLDHKTPLSRGGSNWLSNLQWLCAFHNVSKGVLTDPEYRNKIGLPVLALAA